MAPSLHRQVALAEARSLLQALNAPDQSGVISRSLSANPVLQKQYNINITKAQGALQNVADFQPGAASADLGAASDVGSAADALGVIGLLPLIIEIQLQGGGWKGVQAVTCGMVPSACPTMPPPA
jgi:hypothetical protein